MMWAIFALSLLIRLIYNLSQPSTALFACDGFEYLTDAQNLLNFVQNQSLGFKSLHGLSIAGPVFPSFIVGSYLLFGSSPVADHAMPLLITQSLISAATAVFIAGIARICWNRRTGWIAGLIAAFYPAFIINSGRLYTETFAVFLLTGLILLICKIIQRPNLLVCVTAGITAAALQLTRSSMAGISAISILFVAAFYLQKKAQVQTLKIVTAFVIGFLLPAILWLSFSYTAFSSASLLLDRAGHYNFYIGNNVDSWGWLSVPHPDLTGIDRASPVQILRCATHKNPVAWCKLLLDKPHRLFDFPWNDFRISLGPINYHFQILFHQAFLLLSVIGIGLCLFLRSSDDRNLYSQQLACRLFALGVLSFHLIYMFFITVPRYNLSAMPIVIAFAAAASVRLFQLLGNKEMHVQLTWLAFLALVLFLIAHLSLQHFSQLSLLSSTPLLAVFLLSILKAITSIALFYVLWRAAINEFASSSSQVRRGTTAVIAMLALIITVVLAVPVRAEGRSFECQVILPPGKILTSSIQLPLSLQKDLALRNCYLLLDSNGLGPLQHGVVVRVNGRQLSGPFVPGLSLMGDLSGFQAFDLHQIYLECGYIFNCLSSPSNISNIDLRQWFFVPLPQDVIESASKHGSMQIEIRSVETTPFTMFAERVVGKHLLMPNPEKCSWEKAFYGVENYNSFNDPRYDFKLSPAAQDGTLIANTLLLIGNKCQSVAPPITVPPIVEQQYTEHLSIYSSSIPSYDKNSFWIVRIAGHVSPAAASLLKLGADGSQSPLATQTCIVSQLLPSPQPVTLTMASKEWAGQNRSYGSIKIAQTFTYNPPWMPRLILNTKGTSFDIAFPLVPSAMPGKLLSVKLSMGSGSIPLKLLDCKMEIYDLPSSPLNPPLHIQAPERLSIVSSFYRHW